MIKVERSYPAPGSLAIEAQKKDGKYNETDVIQQLKHDFHDKCYICGIKELQDPQVEHRLPHKNCKYPERKFNWDNLFWSCGHCNGVKNRNKFDSGILDCCKDDPEEHMRFLVFGDDVKVSALDDSDDVGVLTAQLMNDVFNLKNTGMRMNTSDMRVQGLKKEMNVLYGALQEWKDNPKSKMRNRMLRALLRRESKFAEFKRCYIRDHAGDYQGLMKYIV